MRRQKIVELQTEIISSMELLTTTRLRLREYLVSIQDISADSNGGQDHQSDLDLFPLYQVFLEREKRVYTTFNKMKIDDGSSLVTGFAWIPRRSIKEVTETLTTLKDSDP